MSQENKDNNENATDNKRPLLISYSLLGAASNCLLCGRSVTFYTQGTRLSLL